MMPDARQSLAINYDNAFSRLEPSYASNDADGAGNSLYTGTSHGSSRGSLYTGAGRDSSSNLRATKKRSKALIAGAAAGILVFLGVAFLGGSNSLLPAAMSALFTQNTDTEYASYYERQSPIMTAMLSGETDDITLPNSGVPESLKENLAYYGIEVQPADNVTAATEPAAGSGASVLVWTDSNDVTHTITSATFSDYFYNNVEFRTAYMNAKQGRAANFFDEAANSTYADRNISRNIFKEYIQTGNLEQDIDSFNETMTPYFNGNQTGINAYAEGLVHWKQTVCSYGPDVPEGSCTTTEWDADYSVKDSDPLTAKDDGSDGRNVVDKLIESDIYELQGVEVCTEPDEEGNYTCTTTWRTPYEIPTRVGRIDGTPYDKETVSDCSLASVSAIMSSSIAVAQREAGMRMFMQIMESVSKMKLGEGDASAIHASMNLMSTPETITVQDFNSITTSRSEDDANITVGDTTITQSPLEETGIQMLLGGATVNTSKTNNNFSLERVILASEGVIENSDKNIYSVCRDTTKATDTNMVAFSSNLNNNGNFNYTTNFANELTSEIETVGETTKITGQLISASWEKPIEGIVGFITPTISTVLLSNMFTTTGGVYKGALIALGAYGINSLVGRQGSGQMFANAESAITYNRTNNVVLALDAEIERNSHSPFDITNQNTFFGSIAYSLLPTFTSSRLNTVSSFLYSTSNSIASLLNNSAFADGEGNSYMTTFGNCPFLESAGYVGDYYCNPIIASDTSTTGMPIVGSLPNSNSKAIAALNNTSDNDYTTYRSVISDSLKKNSDTGQYEINRDEEFVNDMKNLGSLADYLDFCVYRESPVGVIDQNILGTISERAMNDAKNKEEDEEKEEGEEEDTGGGGFFSNLVHKITSFVKSAAEKVSDIISATLSAISRVFKSGGLNVNIGYDDLQYAHEILEDDKLISWATGAECGMSDTNTPSNVTSYDDFWEERGKYYQRYIEDQRILTQMGEFEDSDTKSPISLYRQQRAAEPVDNSYAGYIARTTGITKDDAESFIAVLNYYDFINQYDASTRIALDDSNITHTNSSTEVAATVASDRSPAFPSKDLKNEPFSDIDAKFTVIEPVVCADLRNRSYAA